MRPYAAMGANGDWTNGDESPFWTTKSAQADFNEPACAGFVGQNGVLTPFASFVQFAPVSRFTGLMRLMIGALLVLFPACAAMAGGVVMQPKIVQPVEGVFNYSGIINLLQGQSVVRDWFEPNSALKGAIWELEKVLPTASPRPVDEALLPTQCLLIGLASEHPLLKKLKAEWKSKLPKEGLGEEGYLLDIAPKRILLTADKPAGLFYGLCRLIERIEEGRAKQEIPCAKIADWPTLRWRGMHIIVNGRGNLPAIERLITEQMPRLRLNQLILEINYNFAYKSHPELVSDGALTVEDCQRLRDLARKSNVRLVPMLNCLGHQSWAKETAALLKTHPEFDETPDIPPDNPGIYCRSWCPSHPDINKVVFALFDELLDAFQADAFHVGMDEVFLLGKCPRCQGKDNAELFAKAVNDYHKHLVGKRKVEMMLWADRLLDNAVMKYGEWEASVNGTAGALQKISKDIVLCDWHYETPDDFPSVKYLQEQGFRVWPSGWNRVENVKRLTACALKNRGTKMLGYLATTWGSVDRLVPQLAGEAPDASAEANGANLAEAVRLGAQIAWTGN